MILTLLKKSYIGSNLFQTCFKKEGMVLQLLLQSISLLWLLILPLAAAAPPSMTLPNCAEACGNVSIPYPFGIGKGCSHNESFAITCNVSLIPNKPFLSKSNLEVLSVALKNKTVTLNIPMGAANSKCPGKGTSALWTSTSFTGSPFRYSGRYNKFTVVGCDNALLNSGGKTMAGCTSECIPSNYTSNTTRCYGIDCCQTSIPTDLDIYNITISGNADNCTKAFLASNDWYSRNSSDPYAIYDTDQTPVVIYWGPANAGYYHNRNNPGYNCFTPIEDGSGNYYCECGWAYEGNPYIPEGCKVAEACADCEKECDIREGGELYCNRSYKTEIILGSSLGGGLLLILLGGVFFWLYKLMKKRRLMKLKQKFFKRNGGLLLQQLISSNESEVEKTTVFTSHELKKATDNFNVNRILGQGGQGTVYKGMLSDGKIVAIKKSTVVDESQLEQFINEVVILSQINHRNIVKLLGCCLETEVPLIVYEFISNGNLFQLIHDQNEEFPPSWKMRLQIATEVAGALAYLHSASSIPIYHRDVKSTNILLDDKFRAKVADFGTSRSIAIEQTHLTTQVQGTFGYLDPEYFQSSQFTEKSDVYSYGVVLVELLTGKEAVSLTISEEEKSLATRFILSLKKMQLFSLLDSRVIEEARQEEVIAVADIAKRCLSLSGKKRPTMKEVMMELEGIRMSQMPLTHPQQNFHEDQYIIEMTGPIDTTPTPNQSGIIHRRALPSDVDPLLVNTE